LAEAYRQVGLLEDALEVCRLGTKSLPHFSPGFSTMGRVLGQMGRLDEAMTAYAQALTIDRQSQSALVGLARLHLIRGERDQARRILGQAQGFHPGDEKITDMLTAMDLPRPWEQIPLVPQQQEPAPPTGQDEGGDPIPTATLAEIHVKQGLVGKAIKIYEDILVKDPDNATARERVLQLKTGSGSAPHPAMVPPGDLPEEPVNMSPLAVLQRWLSAIQKGRAHVQ
jgi:tetratricopeptide (TPR) repeat protein